MSRIDELQPGYQGPQTPNVGRDNLAAILSRFFGGQGAFPAAPTFEPFSNAPPAPDMTTTAAVPTPRPQTLPDDPLTNPMPTPAPMRGRMNRGMW